jgi:tRNA pseudouridine55 synthase
MCLGGATRLSEYLAGKDKRYTATVRLGQTTNTYDSQGEVTSSSQELPSREAVEATLDEFRGPLLQTPPAFSAIKRAGQKAYDLARRGETVVLEPRRVHIWTAALTDWQPPEFTLEVHCSAGTYIRSLAHDLGQRLGCGAHLAALRRTASGGLRVTEAVTLPDLQAAFAAGDWQRLVLPADLAVPEWPAVRLTEEGAARVRQGQAVPLTDATGEHGRAYNAAGEFFAVLRADREAGVWRPDKVFSD